MLKPMLAATALLTVIASNTGLARTTAHAGAPPPLTVTGVAANNSSAKIDFIPVTGAKDYRVYDVNDPMTVKYAGMLHLDAGYGRHFVMQSDGVTPVFPYTSASNRQGSGPQTLNEPNTEIEWNMLGDGQPHTLVVQALDNLGPVPPSNLASFGNSPLNPPATMLGADDGPTPDGNSSINGQGPYTVTTNVIAQSAPFVVQANAALRALPSSPDAVQTFFDTFDDSEAASLAMTGTVNKFMGNMNYTLNGNTAQAWDIMYHYADTDHSMPLVDNGHFMDVLFDGITPSALPPKDTSPYHSQYASMSLSPQTTADLSGGKLLHMTMEVDSHLGDSHRWLAWQLAPATTPITNFVDDNYVTQGFRKNANTLPPDQSDQALWVQLFPGNCDAMLFEGPTSVTNTVPLSNQFIPMLPPGRTPPCLHSERWGGNGIGLDNRDRWDLFLTTTHLAIFLDGQLLIQSDIPDGGLPFTQAKAYFTHYVYSTQVELPYLQKYTPYETYWINYVPYSDERHWDNMGFEVLPATDVPADWSTLASRIQMPSSVPPQPAQ